MTANLNQSIRLKELGLKQRGSEWVWSFGVDHKIDMNPQWYLNNLAYMDAIGSEVVVAPTTDEMLEVICDSLTLGYVGRSVTIQKSNDSFLNLPNKWFAQIDLENENDYFSEPYDSPAEALADLLIKLIEAKEITL